MPLCPRRREDEALTAKPSLGATGCTCGILTEDLRVTSRNLDGRWATGDTLVYHEAEGSYDMDGAPVEIVEEVEPDEPIDEPAPEALRA